MKNFNLDKFIETIENMRNVAPTGYAEGTYKVVRWTKYERDRLYIKMVLRKREIDMGYIDLLSENFSYYVNLTGELDTISDRINDIRKENITEEDETVEETVDETVEENNNEVEEVVDETTTASEITYEVKTDERNRKYIETENCKLIVSERFIKIYYRDGGAYGVEKDKDILTTYIEKNKDNEEEKELVNCLTYIRDTNFLETNNLIHTK